MDYLAEAEQLDPDSAPIRIVDVNIRVQRARIAPISDQAFSLAGALSAQKDALSLREEMISMGRWSESGRLLMLAADVSGALRDLEGAEAILRRLLPEEVAAQHGAVVLGDAALRAGAPTLTLEIVAQAFESDALARIRAAAKVDIGGPGRVDGLATLEKLALSDSPEREQAAAERLAACMAPVRAPWNEQVAQVLAASPTADMVLKLRPMVLATEGDFVQAERLAAQLPDNVASAEVCLRIAGMSGQHSRMKEAADRFLDFGPDATGRLIAAAALAAAGEVRRGGEITAQIAHDPNAPRRVRRTLSRPCSRLSPTATNGTTRTGSGRRSKSSPMASSAAGTGASVPGRFESSTIVQTPRRTDGRWGYARLAAPRPPPRLCRSSLRASLPTCRSGAIRRNDSCRFPHCEALL
jgi:hypothetical protein